MYKYNTKDKVKRHVTKIEIFCEGPKECTLFSFDDMAKGMNQCMYCGRLCCPCFLSETDKELCIPCQADDN